MASNFWAIGPTGAAHRLRLRGFTPRETERLVALRVRFERDALGKQTGEERRLHFVRWLVAHGRLTDWPTQGNGHRHAPEG